MQGPNESTTFNIARNVFKREQTEQTSIYLLAVFPLGVHSKEFLCDFQLQVSHWAFVIVWAAGL